MAVCWNDDKLKSLWASMLDVEVVTRSQQDVELQGMLLLVETIFTVFSNLKRRYDEMQAAYQSMKSDFLSTRDDLLRVKEQLKCERPPCKQCPQLEKQLELRNKKLELNEMRIKSIVSILNTSNSPAPDRETQLSCHSALTKAYNLVSQMLVQQDDKHLGEEKPMGTTNKEKHDNPTEGTELPTPCRKRKKRNANDEGAGEIGNATLVPESVPMENHFMALDVCKEMIPESLSSQFPVTELRLNNADGGETTPEKQAHATPFSSPILGGSGRKCVPRDSCCNSSVLTEDGSVSPQTEENCRPASLATYFENDATSPSLLKVPAETSDKSCASKLFSKQDSVCDVMKEGTKVKADFWKLKPTLSSVETGCRKLKQTTLSVGCFSKKQDLCTLKEFNGGVRQSVGDSSGRIDCDFDKETCENVASQPRDDDEFILTSPGRASPRKKLFSSRMKTLLSRKDKAVPRRKHLLTPEKDLDETLFVPLLTSTDQNCTLGGRERRTDAQHLSSEQLSQQRTLPTDSQPPMFHTKNNTSFDKIPDKVLTSPDYKYRRDAVRKRAARQKLEGWECDQCEKYYALATDPKHRLNQCSRHRAKYPVRSNTPKGYWDVNFPDLQDGE